MDTANNNDIFVDAIQKDRHCYWYDQVGDTSDNNVGDSDYTENQLQTYWTILGDIWELTMYFTCFFAVFAWYLFL